MQEYLRTQKAIMTVYSRTPTLVGGLAVAFFKDRFKFEAWHDKSREPWEPRKQKDRRGNKRQILTKTRRLRRSIRVVAKTRNYVRVGTDVEYAQAHNEGSNAMVTQNIRKHDVRAHRRRGSARRKAHNVKEHTREAHSRSFQQNIPARPFMGPSAFLDRRIEMNLEHELKKELQFLKPV